MCDCHRWVQARVEIHAFDPQITFLITGPRKLMFQNMGTEYDDLAGPDVQNLALNHRLGDLLCLHFQRSGLDVFGHTILQFWHEEKKSVREWCACGLKLDQVLFTLRMTQEQTSRR